jgi:threonine 3-dehydrogenase
MRALVKATAGPGLELTDVPEPPMGIDDVRIRVHRTGICGTDLHIAAWDAWAARTIRPPLVVGHEFVGEVLEIGSNVHDLQPGDLVSGEGHVVCGRCRHCRAGRYNLCANTVGLGVNRDGAFAEQVVLPVTNVWHHWPGIDEDVAAIFDPFGNAVHTALSFPVLGEDVLVVGAGPIGLMAAAVARHAGARFVVVSEPNRVRRELALRLGATDVVDPTERTLRDIQAELGMVEGFDVVLEMSGNAGALRDALGNMAHGGGMAILGIPTDEIPIDVSQVVFNQLTLRGIYGREMYETWYKMSVMLQSGLDLRPAITHRFSYRDHEAAFAAARSGESGKVLMDWTD